jgi:hypothetical protein
MTEQTTATATAVRTVSEGARQRGVLDVSSLVLLAVLLAAGTILNMTVGNALAAVGIKPQFIISAYALAILLTDARASQAALYGLLSAAVIQLSTSIPGLNFVTELAGALAMYGVVRLMTRDGLRAAAAPLVAAFVATLVSGALFAVLGSVVMGAAVATALVKVPIVLGTAAFNAVVVQALVLPLSKVLHRA